MAGCSAPAPAKEPATDEERPPTDDGRPPPATLEDAARSFDNAERELAGLFGKTEGEGADLEAAPPAQAPADEPAQKRSESEAPQTAPPPPPDRCTVACRALASMRRSADRLCELSGEGDARCSDVQKRTERARERVSRTCPRCAAGRRRSG